MDSVALLEDALGQVLPKYGRTLPLREVLAVNFHGSLEDTFTNTLGQMDPAELTAIVQDFLAVQDSHYETVERHILPDALRLAERAHAAGYRQILVTNRAHTGRLRASPRSIVANSDLCKYMDRLGPDWQMFVTIVPTLDAVEV